MSEEGLVGKLYKILEESPKLERLLYISKVDHLWCRDRYGRGIKVSYNSDNNKQALYTGSGNTYNAYSFQSNGNFVDLGDYWAVNLDRQMGYNLTTSLKKDMEIVTHE